MRKITIITITTIVMCVLVFSFLSGCTTNNKPVPKFYSTGNLTVTFLDVGQGDSEIIESPSGKIMLIDAGESDQSSKVSGYLFSLNQNLKIVDDVVISHAHSDHIGGMNFILQHFDVKNVYDSGFPHTSNVYENVLMTIDKKNIPYTVVKNGDSIDFDPNVNVIVVNPQSKMFDDINDNSVVLKIVYGNVSFLLAGDTESSAEKIYADKVGKVNILKVAHHGSSTSTGKYFVSKVDPEVSIISVGNNNPYGHPSDETLKNLVSSKIYRTDVNGDIIITTDGNTYSIITERY